MNTPTVHQPILVQPIVDALILPFQNLSPEAPPQFLVDCTLGGGGHTGFFLEAFSKDETLRRHRVISFDQDASAIERAQARFAQEIREGRLHLVHAPFSEAREAIEALAPSGILGLMADLGFSSDQIEDPTRGLSFMSEGPLDMRMGLSRGVPCSEYLRHATEDELETVLREYGEERFSRRIASRLVEARRAKNTPTTTRELRELVVSAIPPKFRHGRIHAATRTFQALRIAVNHEMEELDTLLSHVILGVNPGGRVAILSFHSLEDRKVKQAFRAAPFKALTKKPIIADNKELDLNPRARSAKLRIAERT